MKNIIITAFFLTLLFSQNEIEGRWHLLGYEDNVMYQFVDTEPFADAGYRYTIYSTDGNFGDLDEAGGSPNPYSIVDNIITMDLFFGTIVNYQMNYMCDNQVVEFKYIPDGIIHSTLFREGYNYIDNNCSEILGCCEAEEIATNNCGGLGCYIPQCIENCQWEPMQCWSSTGYCWCVDENGIEIEGTSMPSWQGFPDCQQDDECIDGEINNENPCNPMECWDGQWYEIIIDCAENMGFPCEGGLYIPPNEGECCSECILFGDINYDYAINILDVVEIVQLVLSGEFNEIVDINYDGTINILDIIEIIQIILD
tara:strand:+ start:2647 stop:3582 length:936 start_codon:yes stop_codon:yes gene_type:complete